MTAVEGCRLIAQEIWRVERPPEPFFVHGLSAERAVRDRLQKTALELAPDAALSPGIAALLKAIHFGHDDPLTILERTEAMIAGEYPGEFAGTTELIQRSGALALRLLIVQCIGGRLGRWAVRSPEIPDARTARALYKDLGQSTWSQYRALLETSEELIAGRRFREAASSLFDADRLVRTSAGLLRAATALTQCGDYISALWTVRACLLEPRSGFESAAAIERALRLESRLRAVIEGRAAVPLSEEEARMVLGDAAPPVAVPRKATTPGRPKPTAELIHRPALPARLPRTPAAPPPLRASEAFAAASTQVGGLPPERALPPRGSTLPPPLAPRRSTLPPSKKHAVMLAAERAEAPFSTERVQPSAPTSVLPRAASRNVQVAELLELEELKTDVPPPPSARAAILGAAEGMAQVAAAPLEPARLVSETFELERIDIEEEIELELDERAPAPSAIKAEPISEEWVVQPPLEDLPTDTSMPRPPSNLPQPCVYEITERIRPRAP